MPSVQSSPAQVRSPASAGRIWLWSAIGVVGVGIVALTVLNFSPLFRDAGRKPEDTAVKIPPYDVSTFAAMPVQDRGRYKPFETAAVEVVRFVTGRARLQGKDAVSVVLMWMFEEPADQPRSKSAWDKAAFILCENEKLRNVVYRLTDAGTLSEHALAEGQQVHGKYLSPAELRAFRERMNRLMEHNRQDYKAVIGPVEREAHEALDRLAAYENVRQRPLTSTDTRPADPFGYVALDKVKGSPWFTIADLRLALNHPEAWQNVLMKDRVKNAPQLYVSPEHRKALHEFQAEVKSGDTSRSLGELRAALDERACKTRDRYLALARAGKKDEAVKVLQEVLAAVPGTKLDEQHGFRFAPEFEGAVDNIRALIRAEVKDGANKTEEVGRELDALAAKVNAKLVADVKERLPAKKGYDPEDPKFRMLHLTYLETRFPDVYKVATSWQTFPEADARRVVAAFNKVGAAYRSGDAGKFSEASQKFVSTVREVSEKFGHAYPGEDTVADRLHMLVTGEQLNPPGQSLLDLERLFNRVQPFMWGWILMLVGAVCLAVSLALDARWPYRIGLAFYLGSVGFQLFGFFTRIVIAGRPPVSNMYETVIWVAFMTGIFALVLEAIYRRTVIALAGAVVSTIALVLADQLPLALDPKINPLVPVLRSNFWLTIHVLTIVSSYAAGALAWGLGNISLLLILFASNKRETIKTLASFTYRALQIAVLLLAAGTFLGGWWAAYSWGRFWGWDPKETGALIALLCYVIPLHMRYIGWIKDFGLAVAAIVCFAAILMSWYGINFWIPAGLHSYGFGGGGVGWVFWASLLNIQWVLVASLMYQNKLYAPPSAEPAVLPSEAAAPPASVSPQSEHVEV